MDEDVPRVTLVHDYLTQRGGAERVVLSLRQAFPEADLYTSLFEAATTFPEFGRAEVQTLGLNHIAAIRRHHRLALPLLAGAFAAKRVSGDVVICSSSGWAHGIRTTGRKIVYCHSPAKWLYRKQDYLAGRFGVTARVISAVMAPALRIFDRWAASSADVYVANSTFVAEQIEQIYGIHARVVPPPVGLDANGVTRDIPGIEPGFFLTVARLMPYKNVAEIAAAFRSLEGEKLVVVGDGPERAALEASAPPNVRFVGEIDDEELRWLYANCAGLLCASREDFGLTPIEAAAFGKPTAALRYGGFLDTVVEGKTGIFFGRVHRNAIAEAVRQLDAWEWDGDAITAHAGIYSVDRFVEAIHDIVAEVSEETLVTVQPAFGDAA